MNKKAIRAHYKNRRQALTSIQREKASLEIANRLLDLPVWSKSYFHLFLSSEKHREIDTEPILTVLNAKDKHVVVPKMEKERSLVHYLLTDATPIKENALGIPEPQEGIAIDPLKIDVIFVPLLAFDVYGNRVGYGKGYYDRFLKRCRPESIKIGLSFFDPEKQLPTTATDVPLTYCISPENTYRFNKS